MLQQQWKLLWNLKTILQFVILVVLPLVISLFLFIGYGHNYIAESLFGFGAISTLALVIRYTNKTTKELKASQQKLQNIFDTLDVAIWSHDLKTNTLLITPGIQKLYGHSSNEFFKNKDLWKEVILTNDLPVLKERENNLLEGKPTTSVYRIRRPDGEIRWIQDKGFPKVDAKKNLVDFTSVLFDITDLKESQDRYQSLVEMSPDIIAVISNEEIHYINEAGSKLFGAKNTSELIGKSIWDIAPADAIEKIKTESRKNVKGNIDIHKHFEFQISRLDGFKIDVEISTMNILYEGRTAIQIVGRDISERKKAQKIIHQMAYFDSLTDLPNRNMFNMRLNKIYNSDEKSTFAIMFVDLDRFKIINDTKGHTIGDLILQEVAYRLKNTLDHQGTVYRQGGDEFIILLEDLNREKIGEVAQTIINAFSFPFEVGDQEFFITPSIGISMYPDDGEDEETLIKHSDTAMYFAKAKGKNNYQFYHSSLDTYTHRKIELENGLRKAVEQEQLSLHYQPKVDLQTRKVIGLEALLRWHHPVFGAISPVEFIPISEESGLIVPIGKWVLEEANKQIKHWIDRGIEPISIAINISVRQIQDDCFIDDVKRIIEYPSYVELEITESIMQNIEKSIIILHQLKDMGFKLSIDDFGTGYSSLSYLKHLPIDHIKIDKSFVDDILVESNQGSIVKAIIDMGHNLNFNIIAEGIEHEDQINFLIQNNCLIGQGYYFCKPLPIDQLDTFLSENGLHTTLV